MQILIIRKWVWSDMVLPVKYGKDDIVRGLKDPQRIVEEAKYLYKSSLFKYKYRNTDKGNPIMEDWDNLILLDSCRYDILQQTGVFDEEVGYKILRSSTSPEFCEEYIHGNEFQDSIYVTGNPYGAQVDDNIFYNKYSTFNADIKNINKSWHPETVYQLAVENHKENPNKRMMVHFMQPHFPYFGDRAEELRNELREEGYIFWAWNEELGDEDKNRDDVITTLMAAAKDGLISVDDLTEIYIDNIEIAAEYVKKLANEVGGKTVVSADHGEMLRWKIGHSVDLYTEGLRKVPWVVLDYDQRRETYEEEPQISQNVVDSDIEAQLGALGYK